MNSPSRVVLVQQSTSKNPSCAEITDEVASQTIALLVSVLGARRDAAVSHVALLGLGSPERRAHTCRPHHATTSQGGAAWDEAPSG